MSDNHDFFAGLIQDEIAKTKEEITGLEESTQPVSPDNSIGRLSRMEAINAQNVAMANLKDAHTRIRKLHVAMQRIEEGEYGECLNCGETISEQRLKSIPEATLCINCAQKREL